MIKMKNIVLALLTLFVVGGILSYFMISDLSSMTNKDEKVHIKATEVASPEGRSNLEELKKSIEAEGNNQIEMAIYNSTLSFGREPEPVILEETNEYSSN
ncbi:hypothetical protein [Guptibacillus hwajinpoensis]|uniref:hypothetical protein n=1 Tax=Guptibacillus hwajinpoensis TaxID=208199 RepID=UPI001CFCC028|nr:hypothetical protein [Pseudalkalibacillus hwajinpoensis]WLR59031.1 hypothetical protein LC071_18050 [Pseudalkalibacillus hwajinpoensis]